MSDKSAAKRVQTSVKAWGQDGKPVALSGPEAVYELVRALADLWGSLAPEDKAAAAPIIREAFGPFFASAPPSVAVQIPYRDERGQIIGTVNVAGIAGAAAEALAADAKLMVTDLASDAKAGAFAPRPQ